MSVGGGRLAWSTRLRLACRLVSVRRITHQTRRARNQTPTTYFRSIIMSISIQEASFRSELRSFCTGCGGGLAGKFAGMGSLRTIHTTSESQSKLRGVAFSIVFASETIEDAFLFAYGSAAHRPGVFRSPSRQRHHYLIPA